MTVSSRLKWPVPTEGSDPWFDAFDSLIGAIDTSSYASREDRNLIITKGGTFSLTVGLLSWDATVEIVAPITGHLWTVAAGSVTMEDGEIMYVNLPRAPTTSTATSFVAAGQLPFGNDYLMVAVRRNDRVYFRTGAVLLTGQSIEIFQGDSGAGSGFTTAGAGLYSVGLTVHIGDGAGIATNTNDIEIALAATPGLELTDGTGVDAKLAVKLQTEGGLDKDASGVGVRVDTVSNNGNPTIEVDGNGVSVIGVPLNFEILGVATGNDVTAANLDTLTDGSDASTLHTHTTASAFQLFTKHLNDSGGDNIFQGDPVAQSTESDRVIRADCDVLAESLVIGVNQKYSVSGLPANAETEIVSIGLCTGALTSYSFTIGNAVYLDSGGGLTETPPSSGRIIRVGYAHTANDLFVMITDLGYVEP